MLKILVRRLPTFAQRTIIGLDGFHFCDRDGNRWSAISITSLLKSQTNVVFAFLSAIFQNLF